MDKNILRVRTIRKPYSRNNVEKYLSAHFKGDLKSIDFPAKRKLVSIHQDIERFVFLMSGSKLELSKFLKKHGLKEKTSQEEIFSLIIKILATQEKVIKKQEKRIIKLELNLPAVRTVNRRSDMACNTHME